MNAIKMLAAVLSRVPPITIDGDLDATAVAGVSTSATRTLTIPETSSGQITISFSDTGSLLAAQYSKNGGAFTTFSTGDTITFANGDTIALRANGNGAGESRVFTLTDVSGARTLGVYTHTGA